MCVICQEAGKLMVCEIESVKCNVILYSLYA